MLFKVRNVGVSYVKMEGRGGEKFVWKEVYWCEGLRGFEYYTFRLLREDKCCWILWYRGGGGGEDREVCS